MPSSLVVLFPIVLVVVVFGILWMAMGSTIRTLLRARWITQNGEPAEARVLAVRETNIRVNGMPVVELDLEVHRRGRSPYAATTRKRLSMMFNPLLFAPGSRIKIKVHPQYPEQVAVLDESAQLAPVGAGAGPAQVPAGDPSDRLRELEQMRDQGLITTSEYETKRADILERL